MASTLSFSQAQNSPCERCSAPCCTYLPLHEFSMYHFNDVDYAIYLSQFENIELALVNGNTWRVHYAVACSRLKQGRCTLHGLPEKPKVCLNYDAYRCFYKPMFLAEETPAFIRFDRERLCAYADLLEFDDARNIVGYPDPQHLLQHLPAFHPAERTVVREPEEMIAKDVRSMSEIQRSCEGCAAWCCTTLSFPFAGISHISNLDYLWFGLGFPGVELCITPEAMAIFVRTRCRSFLDSKESQKCGLYGSTDRPLVCSKYDEMTCAYRAQVGIEHPSQSLRIQLKDFSLLSDALSFDSEGQVVEPLNFRAVQQAFYNRVLKASPGSTV